MQYRCIYFHTIAISQNFSEIPDNFVTLIWKNIGVRRLAEFVMCDTKFHYFIVN